MDVTFELVQVTATDHYNGHVVPRLTDDELEAWERSVWMVDGKISQPSEVLEGWDDADPQRFMLDCWQFHFEPFLDKGAILRHWDGSYVATDIGMNGVYDTFRTDMQRCWKIAQRIEGEHKARKANEYSGVVFYLVYRVQITCYDDPEYGQECDEDIRCIGELDEDALEKAVR